MATSKPGTWSAVLEATLLHITFCYAGGRYSTLGLEKRFFGTVGREIGLTFTSLDSKLVLVLVFSLLNGDEARDAELIHVAGVVERRLRCGRIA